IMLNYYLFALVSILVGIVCLVLAKSSKYYGRVEQKYGEAGAQKMTRSLKIWGYFFLITSGILILTLAFERAR
ncbi:MAG: hypothetical protein ACHQX0_02250, partial [Desulfobaccales bacterium]